MNPQALAAQTIAHYERYAVSYRDGTADHDVSQNIEALLAAIEGPAPFHVLDFGCGPGRDLCSFVQRGHQATGLDGSAPFVAMARLASGCEVWQQDFLALDLPAARFDGVFANATLFHVPRSELPRVLEALHHTLKPGGVLFTYSCSGGISADLFHKIVAGAGADAGVDGFITERMGGAPDHPMTISFPEGEYLKGLVVMRKP